MRLSEIGLRVVSDIKLFLIYKHILFSEMLTLVRRLGWLGEQMVSKSMDTAWEEDMITISGAFCYDPLQKTSNQRESILGRELSV